jgi:hypothetical protein
MLRGQLNTEIKHIGWSHFRKIRVFSSLSMLRGQLNTEIQHIGWSHFRKIRVFSSLSMLRGQLNTEIKHLVDIFMKDQIVFLTVHAPCSVAS